MRGLGIVLIVLIVLAVIVVLVAVGTLVWGGLRRWRSRQARKADRETPWSYYSRVVRPQGKPVAYSIGVERCTEDGRVLSDVHIRDVPIGDELERQVAEEEAKLRAQQYNESKVGM